MRDPRLDPQYRLLEEFGLRVRRYWAFNVGERFDLSTLEVRLKVEDCPYGVLHPFNNRS